MSFVIPTTITYSWSCANDKTTSQGSHVTTCEQSCGCGGYGIGSHMEAGGSGNYTITAYLSKPDGTTESATPLEYEYSWEDGNGSGSWAADLRATFGMSYWDAEDGGTSPWLSTGTGIGTPRSRPSHIRQCHGYYGLAFDTDITWSNDIELNYTGSLTLAEADALYGPATGWEHVGEPVARTAAASDSGTHSTLVAGVRAEVYNPIDTENDSGSGLPILNYTAGIGWNYGTVDVPIGTYFATLTGSVTGSTADLSVYDSTNATTASGLTVTAKAGDYRGDAFDVGPDIYGTLATTAPEWDGGEVGLKGTPAYPGSTGLEGTSGGTWSGRITNSIGPGWYYSWSRPSAPTGWTLSYPFSFPLNANRGTDQAHWYGAYERLWVRPPEAGATWTPFTISHTASVTVDTMTGTYTDQTVNNLSGGVAGYYEWKTANLGTGGASAVSGTYLTVTVASDAASPTLYRLLQSDWDDCEADPSAFRDDASTPAAIADYIGKAHLGDPHTGGTGFWYNVRKQVRTGSDVYNWSNHRWLKVSGKGGGNWTLRIHADNCTVTDNFHTGELSTNPATAGGASDRVISVVRAPVTVDCGPFAFGVADTDVYIDLADAAERAGSNLAHVTEIEFLLTAPGGGTSVYYFNAIGLASGASTGAQAVNEASPTFSVWAGVPYADDACLVPIADGRACCAQDTVSGLPPWVLSAVWRQVSQTPPSTNPRPVDETKTMEELAEEIGYQEGITVSAVTAPSADFDDYAFAIFFDAGHYTGGNPTATVKCREITVPALLEDTWTAREDYGAAVFGVAIDASDQWAAGSGFTIECDGSRGGGVYDDLSTATTDANGAFLLPAAPQAARGAWQTELDADSPQRQPTYSAHRLTAPGLLSSGVPATDSAACPNRQAVFHVLTGEAPGSTGMVALASSETGFMARAWEVAGGTVRVQRRTLDGGAWSTIGERAGEQPGLYWNLDGAACCVISDAGSVKLWIVEANTVSTLATGTYPQAAISDSGSHRAVSYWRANRHRVRVYDGQGNDLYTEQTVQGSDVSEGPFAIAFRSDGTLEGQYSDGTSVIQLTSDTGEVWA